MFVGRTWRARSRSTGGNNHAPRPSAQEQANQGIAQGTAEEGDEIVVQREQKRVVSGRECVPGAREKPPVDSSMLEKHAGLHPPDSPEVPLPQRREGGEEGVADER